MTDEQPVLVTASPEIEVDLLWEENEKKVAQNG
jgi:hypothetical protein